ncbi:MAG TPA: hypothetical protein VGO00_21490 [Kofleriaceae bacterium]|jgi:hypothetical protein|nr:hypothetical protein [Kofleriaceae bacterium]
MADETKLPAYEHEFSEEHNREFSKLAGAMKFVALVMFILGVVYMILGVLSMSAPIVALLEIGRAVIFMVIGGWLWSAATSFNDIVKTEGNDVMNLMYAMRKLRSVYTLQAWLFVIACILIVIAVFLLVGRTH